MYLVNVAFKTKEVTELWILLPLLSNFMQWEGGSKGDHVGRRSDWGLGS